jgi:hypothetical protein
MWHRENSGFVMAVSLIWFSLKHGNAKTVISPAMALSLVFVFVRFRPVLSYRAAFSCPFQFNLF